MKNPWFLLAAALFGLSAAFLFYCVSRHDPRLPMAGLCLLGSALIYWKEQGRR